MNYYDINGKPTTMREWAERPSEDFERACRKTAIEDSEVSTVHLGLDHQWGDGPPLIFESMVFGGGLSDTQVRYSTLTEAHAGHDALVEKVRVEADAFRALASEPDVIAAVRLIQVRLTTHLEAFDIYDYDGRAYTRLVEAIK